MGRSKSAFMRSLNFYFVMVLGIANIAANPAHYPNHWWTAIQDPHPPAWEVLPQAAKRDVEVIVSKRNELGILSNFAEAPFTFHGKKYQSIEGFWQMMFYPENDQDPRMHAAGVKWPHTREAVSQMSSFEAKLAGDVGFENQKKLGIDWVSFEGKHLTYYTSEKGALYALIREAMRAKLEQNAKVKEVLLSTGNLVLLPDHHQPEDAPPSWRYCAIWMELRSELQKTGVKPSHF
jgi:predicted NAD-dependent protein-ADP-ribosyltransferase YbiA (DUF1768 family)